MDVGECRHVDGMQRLHSTRTAVANNADRHLSTTSVLQAKHQTRFLGEAHVESIKRSLEPVLTAYEKVGASKYAAEVSSILVCCCCGWHTLL